MLEEVGLGDGVESVEELAGILDDVFTDSTDGISASGATAFDVPCSHSKSR